MSDADPKTRGIEFYKVNPQYPPPGDPADPYFPTEMIYKNEDDQRVFETIAPTVLGNQKADFVMFEEMPLNMIVTEFGPNYVLPQHSHREDCLYYVERGEITMGSHKVGPGEGFLVRADQPYAYTAGPEGVRVLEIRHQPMAPPNLTLHQKNMRAWTERFFEAMGEAAPEIATS